MRLMILVFLLGGSSLLSTEIDSFTLRDPYMEEALPELNHMMQGYFEQALAQANQAGSCEPETIESALHRITGGFFWAAIETDIQKSEILDRRTIALSRSIYRNAWFIEAPALHLAQLGFLMKIQDFYVGSDKIGHFIDTGYQYYKKSSLEDAMAFGEMTERTYYGLTSTAVYSYGDLAANLDGYAFWRQLAQGNDPYFICTDNIWVQKRNFDFADYSNAAWDEGINCSYYRNDHITYSVADEILKLGLTCPVKPGYCKPMIERYGLLAPHVVTDACFN